MDDQYDLRELPQATVGAVPWSFRLGQFLSRHHIRGGDRLLATARRHGWLDRLAQYSIGPVRFRVPLWRPCNQWLADDVARYEAPFMNALGRRVQRLRGAVTFIDCGADIGTVSALLVARCSNIARIIAFEPNAAAYRVLAQNLAALPLATTARHAAVGSFTGRGRLVRAPQDPSAHAMYIERATDGPIAVQRVDELELSSGAPCAMKIDVEGAEAAVVEGAAAAIRNAGDLIVAFEAHPKVARRNRHDPIDIVRSLVAIRPDLRFEVDQAPGHAVRLDTPFFEQVTPTHVYNVIAYSHGS